MRTRKGIVNIDKLRLSFRQPQELWQELIKHPIERPKNKNEKPKNKYVDFGDFKLHIIDDGRGKTEEKEEEKEPIKIIADVILFDNSKLGTFTFNNSAKYDGLCFFTFENKALYTTDTITNGEKFNKISYIQPIADILELTINSITEVELSADVNFNPSPIIRKLIRDYENFDMIVNRKRVEDENRTIEDYGEWFDRSRKKLNRYPTIYVRQSNDDGQKLRIYNKSEEIREESDKNYINEWDNFGSADIYRLEVSVKWENFKKWLDYIQKAAHLPSEWKRYISENPQDPTKSPTEPMTYHLERTLWLLQFHDYRAAMWHYCTEKMLYFRHRATNTPITLTDIGADGKTALEGLK